MEVVSGAMGKERIHFEAPAAKKLGPEMGASSIGLMETLKAIG
jgi:hypothetical protein